MNRRSLLRGLPRADQPAGLPSPAAGSTRGWSDRLRARRSAMGSFFEIQLPVALPGALALAESALDLIERLEGQLTIYRDDSEISRVNATAHEHPVAVEPRLFALLERAAGLFRETGGAYDVASGALSMAWGFVRGPRRVPDAGSLSEARRRSGSQLVRLDPSHRTVQFACPGVILNLGSIGKGYAVDRAIELVRAHGWPTPALVQAGQSSVYALGTSPDRLGGGWAVALRNPFDPERPLGTIWLRNRGLGTSGLAFQSFEADGRRYGHLIDPRTGEPASDGPASVTVLAPTAAEADALSTAFYLLGPLPAAAYVARHPGVSALFVINRSGSSSGGSAVPEILSLNIRPHDFDSDPTVPVRPVASPPSEAAVRLPDA
jgi:thiamine biosynthesis lipoprotein